MMVVFCFLFFILGTGLANICLVTPSMTLVRCKIEHAIPRKRRDSCAQHDKGLLQFFDEITEAMLRHVDFTVVKCVLVGSPGFLRDQFMAHILAQAVKTDCRKILDNRSKFVVVHSSSGYKHSLSEILSDPSVQSRLADTKAAAEIQSLKLFHKMLAEDADRAYYGYAHVAKAHALLAIDTLLVTDELFRSADIPTRKKYIALVEQVKDSQATVRVFSSLHVSGEQLAQLSGVAAILRYNYVML